MEKTVLNGMKLKEIANSSHSAKVVSDLLSKRERFRDSSDITRTKRELIRKGEKIIDSEYTQFWKDLENAGIGSVIFGRRGKPDRFEWYYSLKKVAEAAQEGEDTEVAALNESVVKKQRKNKRGRPRKITNTLQIKNQASSKKVIVIMLRDNFSLTLTVPNDFSYQDADLISKALKKLTA